MYNWITLLNTWNKHNIVNQWWYSNIKFLKIKKKKKTEESGKQGVWIPEWDSHFSNQEIVPFGNFFKDDIC